MEQGKQQARVRGVVDQGLLDIGLAEGKSGLPQILGIGAQHDDFIARQTSRQDQPVETVAFGFATPDLAEAILEQRPHDGDIRQFDHAAHAEIMDMHGSGIAPVERVGLLVQYRYAHVLQHRQAARKRNRPADPVHPEAQGLAVGLDRPVQTHGDRLLLRQQFYRLNIPDRDPHADGVAIDRGKSGAICGQQLIGGFLAATLYQGQLQVVGPVAQGEHNFRFDIARVDQRLLARRTAYHEVQARQRRLRQLDGKFDADALQRTQQHILDTNPGFGVELLPRQIDQTGVIAAVGFAPDKDPDLAAVPQAQNAQRRLHQRSFVDLEQLVAWIGFENRQKAFSHVAIRRKSGHFHYCRRLVSQQRNFPDPRVIGRRGKQTDEASLAHNLPC